LLAVAALVATSIVVPNLPMETPIATAAPSMGIDAKCGTTGGYGVVKGEGGGNSDLTFKFAKLDQAPGGGGWTKPSGVNSWRIWYIGGGGGGAGIFSRSELQNCAYEGQAASAV